MSHRRRVPPLLSVAAVVALCLTGCVLDPFPEPPGGTKDNGSSMENGGFGGSAGALAPGSGGASEIPPTNAAGGSAGRAGGSASGGLDDAGSLNPVDAGAVDGAPDAAPALSEARPDAADGGG